ncbi:zinc finger protein 91-like, partial [Penaeus japonicus]|uniref:zinc finger protein 91-like n=1 Tax=Penaeus japonicus TaxID=27405 RepID=UPI001C710A7A
NFLKDPEGYGKKRSSGRPRKISPVHKERRIRRTAREDTGQSSRARSRPLLTLTAAQGPLDGICDRRASKTKNAFKGHVSHVTKLRDWNLRGSADMGRRRWKKVFVLRREKSLTRDGSQWFPTSSVGSLCRASNVGNHQDRPGSFRKFKTTVLERPTSAAMARCASLACTLQKESNLLIKTPISSQDRACVVMRPPIKNEYLDQKKTVPYSTKMEDVVADRRHQSMVHKDTVEGDDVTSECKDCSALHEGLSPECTAVSDSVGRRNDLENTTTCRSRDVEKRYRCEECSSSFKRCSLLRAHKKTHNEGPPFPCSDCNEQFGSKDDWLDHREAGCNSSNVHSPSLTGQNVLQSGKKQRSQRGKHFKCSHCVKSFKSLSSKNDHERNVHNPVRCYSCIECGKSFYKKYNLTIHKETHSKERPHVCKICGKKFKTSQGVRVHKESHSNERPFMCEVCGKVFKTRAVLESHTAIHTGETKYGCSVCGKAYRYRASLFIHMRTHSGHRPYGCTECDASFMVKSHLTEHMRSHTGEHPFVCRFCSASFTRAISLKKHLKSHAKAGCNVNIDAAMYDAKVQAFVKPRKPYSSQSGPDTCPALPKLTHIIQDSVLVNAKEKVELYVDQPSDEKELIVIKVSFIDETGLCAHDIVQTSPDYELLSKSGDIDLVDLQASYSIKKKTVRTPLLQNKNKIQVLTSFMDRKMDEEVKSTPTTSKAQNTINGVAAVKPVLRSYLTEECIVKSRKLEGETAKDWLDSEGAVANAVLELSVSNDDIGSSDHYNLSEMDHKRDVSDVIASENVIISSQLEHSNHYCESERKTTVKSTVVSKSGPIDESFVGLEHQEVLLQKCSCCDRVYVCKVFSEGDELCQDCKAQQQQKTVDSSKSEASCDISENTKPSRNELCSESNPYQCSTCRASFSFRSDLRKHVKQHSSRYPHVCDKCGESFLQEVFLSKHHCGAPVTDTAVTLNRQSPKTTDKGPCDKALEYKCDRCEKAFPKKFILKVHYRKHISVKPFKCKRCSKRFISATHRKVHMRIHTGEQPYECGGCGKRFRKKSTLQSHYDNCENGEKQRIKRDLQGYSVSIKEEPVSENLREISEESGNNKTFTKGIKTEDPGDHRLKQETVEGEEIIPTSYSRSLKCRYCGRAFKFHSVLQAHERSHTGEKPFSCSVCNKAFSKKSNMEVHMRVHTGERPFLCDFCGKYFAYKYSLEAHKRLHTQERPFVCSICGKSFRHEASRHVHMKRHLGDRAFKCDLCPKAFVAKVDLKGHRRTHTGEKPFQCEQCHRAFKFRHHLTEHRRYHTGEKPYKCHYCSMTFARVGTRKTHMKKHTNIMK